MGNIAIYATKGFEYLWILTFLATFTSFFLFFTSKMFEPARAGLARGLEGMLEWFHIPADRLFHQGHTWMLADANDSGAVRVGLDDFAQKMMGKVDMITTAKIGSRVRQGEKAWTLHVGDKAIDMLAPVSGEIVEVNPDLRRDTMALNDDPFGKGWIYKVEPENVVRESKNLLEGGLAKKWMQEVTEKLRMRMGAELGAVYQDGGVPMPGMAKNIDPKGWDKLVEEFFLT